MSDAQIPASLTVTLLRNGTKYGESVTLTKESWTHTFSGLPTHDENGNAYSYSVSEEVPKGYVSKNGSTVQAELAGTEITDGYEATLVNVKSDETPVDPGKTHTATKVQVEGTNQMVEVGGTVTYTITYYNHKNVEADVTIEDILPEGLEYQSSDPNAQQDGQKLTWTIEKVAPFTGGEVTVTVEVTEDALTVSNPVLENTAIVKLGNATQTTRTDTVTVYNPDWTITKKVNGQDTLTAEVDDSLSYMITVENTGNVALAKEFKDIFEVDDETKDLENLTCTNGAAYDSQTRILNLPVGGTAIFTASYTVGATDNTIVNTVSYGDKFSETTVNVTPKPDWSVDKSIAITKAEGNTQADKAEVGDKLKYTVTVVNTGNAEVKDAEVTDTFTVDGTTKELTLSLTNGESGISYENGKLTLAKGKTAIFESAEYVVTATDNKLVNMVVVGDPKDPDAPRDEVTTDVEDKEAWEVTKTVSGMTGEGEGQNQKAQVGDELIYTITVANTGNVEITKPVTDTFKVDDTELTLSLTKAEISQGTYAGGKVTLAEAETIVLMANYTVTATDNKLVNAVVVGDPTDPDDPKDEVTTDVEDKEAWKVTKTVSGMTGEGEGQNQKANVGDELTYTITIENTGNVEITKPVTDTFKVDDTEVELELTKSGSSQGSYADGNVTLAKGETIVLTAGYTVTATDNRLVNAVVVGDPDDPNVQEDEVPTDVEDTPKWTVDKKVYHTVDGELAELGADEKAKVGEVLTYEVTVSNTGNTKIEEKLIDTFLVDEAPAELTTALEKKSGSDGIYTADGNVILEEKETIVLTATYEVKVTDSSILNTAKVGTDPEDPEDPVPTDVEDKPDWTVEKTLTNAGTGENGEFKLGETAEFDIVVTNTGNTELTDLPVIENLNGAKFVEDAAYTVSADGAEATVTIPKNETVTLKAVYTIQEADLGKEIKNVVTTKSGDKEIPGETPVPTDTRNPQLGVTKEAISTPAAANGKYAAGETITYKVRVENTGNLTIQLNDAANIQDVLTRPDGHGAIEPSGIETLKTHWQALSFARRVRKQRWFSLTLK